MSSMTITGHCLHSQQLNTAAEKMTRVNPKDGENTNRKSYTAEFKLKIIKYAAENSNGAAGSLEGVRNLSGTGDKKRKL